MSFWKKYDQHFIPGPSAGNAGQARCPWGCLGLLSWAQTGDHRSQVPSNALEMKMMVATRGCLSQNHFLALPVTWLIIIWTEFNEHFYRVAALLAVNWYCARKDGLNRSDLKCRCCSVFFRFLLVIIWFPVFWVWQIFQQISTFTVFDFQYFGFNQYFCRFLLSSISFPIFWVL